MDTSKASIKYFTYEKNVFLCLLFIICKKTHEFPIFSAFLSFRRLII